LRNGEYGTSGAENRPEGLTGPQERARFKMVNCLKDVFFDSRHDYLKLRKEDSAIDDSLFDTKLSRRGEETAQKIFKPQRDYDTGGIFLTFEKSDNPSGALAPGWSSMYKGRGSGGREQSGSVKFVCKAHRETNVNEQQL
jgi:hypothetical protein